MGSNDALMEEARRLLHGRGEGLSYNIDFIPPYVLIDSFDDLDEKKLSDIIDELFRDSIQYDGIFYRNRKKKTAFSSLVGELPKRHYLIENGLKYEVNFLENQNIGFFMDMKPGRELINSLCQDKSILNLFSYTCSFSVSAKKAGAKNITNIDMKKSFLKIGQKNHQLNNLQGNIKFLSYDIMKSLSGISKKGPWDIIIIDPPSIQKSFKLEQAYPKLLKRAQVWLKNGGKVLACLNDPLLGTDFLLNNNPGWKVEKTFYGGYQEEIPERGLKMVLFSSKSD